MAEMHAVTWPRPESELFSALTSDALKMWLVHVLVACTVVAINGGSKFTLNVPQVLLPLVPSSGVRANFTLTAKQGCFIW